MRFTRIICLGWLLVAVTFPAAADLASAFTNANASRPAPRALPRRTSMILVVCHGLGYGDLSCYGQTNYQTPNLDRLAANGVRSTEYYAGGAEAGAGRLALFTGRRNLPGPATNDADCPWPADTRSVAQRLLDDGYHTGFIGEWGLGPEPWKQGFQEFAGLLTADQGRNYYPDHIWRYAPGVIHSRTNFNAVRDYNGPAEIHENLGGRHTVFFPDRVFTMAAKFVRNNQPDDFNRWKPFFLVLNLSVPRSAAAGHEDFPVPTDAPYSDEPWSAAARHRAALINRLDADFGQFLAAISGRVASNQLAIFFTSDAGPVCPTNHTLDQFQLTGGLRGQRGELYEGGLRVPMIVSWPGHLAPGRTLTTPWAAWDFAPTALDIAYAPPAKEIDGLSALPLLAGSAQPDRDELFIWSVRGPHPAHAARWANWKVVQPEGQTPEFYDLKADQAETNRITDPELAKQFAALPW